MRTPKPCGPPLPTTDAYIYSRFSNPTVEEFTQRMSALEGAESGFATASGMSAIFGSFMAFLKAGDHLLSSASIFGSTHTVITKFLPKWNIQHSYFDLTKPETIEALIQPNTKMIFVETPSNPGLDLIDLELVAKIAKKHNVLLNVDNCFATPPSSGPSNWGQTWLRTRRPSGSTDRAAYWVVSYWAKRRW